MAVCKIISSEGEITSLETSWRALQDRVGLSPFTDYDWAMTWWRTIAKPEGAGIVVAACFEGERLIGLVPFSVRKKRGVKVLRLIGHEVFYYRNFLFETAECMPLVWDAVRACKLYDCAQIKNIHEGTPEHDYFVKHAALREASRVHHMEHAGKTEATLFEGRSSSTRRHFKNIIKTVRSAPDLSYHETENAPVPDDVIEFLLKRKKEWTVEKGKSGIFSEKYCNDFYRKMAELGAAKGNLYLNWLTYKGQIVAATLNFTGGNTVYYHTGTYDPSVSGLKPGLFLCLQVSVWGCAKGFVETNYMEGEEDYKQRFSRVSRVTCEFTFASTMKGWIFLRLLDLQTTVRRMRGGR